MTRKLSGQPSWPNWLSSVMAVIAGMQIVGYLLAALSAVVIPHGHPPAAFVILLLLGFAAAALALPAVLVGMVTIRARRGKEWSKRRLMVWSTRLNAACVVLAATLFAMLYPGS